MAEIKGVCVFQIYGPANPQARWVTKASDSHCPGVGLGQRRGGWKVFIRPTLSTQRDERTADSMGIIFGEDLGESQQRKS